MTKEKLLDTARLRFKLAVEAEEAQRDREKEDLQFQVPELQWTESARRQREGDGNTPARPCLSVSIIDQPLQLLYNQMRAADIGIEVHPISEDADKETAEVKQGLYRDIERRSRAELARAWAYKRAIACGTGAYRVLTEYDEFSDEPTDQRIVIKRILHQEAVYFDPTAEEPDWSDGRFAFVTTWMPKDAFREAYPKAKAPAPDDRKGWAVISQNTPNWVRAEDVLVAEYWWRERTYRDVKVGKKEHKIPEDKVFVAKLCGWDILEAEQEWIGKHIPLIRVLGTEVVPFDEERRFTGIIGPSKDGQRIHNHGISAVVEKVSLEPKAPFVGYADQFEPYKDIWASANIKSFAYLPIAPYKVGDQLAPLPQRVQIDQTGSSLAMMLVQLGQASVQSASSVFDPSLGRENPKERSGRAILALQQQSDAATGQYIEGLADAMRYEALVVLDLMGKVYDRPERVIRIIEGSQKKSKAVMVNAKHYVHPQTGRPVALQEGQQPPMVPGRPMAPMPGMPMPGGPPPGPPPQPQPAEVKEFDLTKGIYDVAIKVGKSYQTRLQEGSDRIGELIAKEPSMAPAFLDIYLEYQDWPGAPEMAKRAEAFRRMVMPGLEDGQQQGPDPKQMAGQMQAMGQQLQLAQAQIGALVQKLETKQAETQAMLMKAQMDNQTRIQVAEINADSQMAIKGLAEKVALIGDQVKFIHEERMEKELHEHEAMQAAIQRDHEREQGAVQRDHERMGMEHDAEMGREQMVGKTIQGREQMAGKAGMAREAQAHESREAGVQREYDSDEAQREREYAAAEAAAGREHEAQQSEADRKAQRAMPKGRPK